MNDIDAPRTLYVSQLVDLPPLTAAAAFDAVTCFPSAARDVYAIRSAHTRLPIARHMSVAVEVDLVPWTRATCEVGVRPAGRSVPFGGGWRYRRYMAVAVPVVELLAADMVSVVDEWAALGLAEARHPSRWAA
jgi:hypothetical protein